MNEWNKIILSPQEFHDKVIKLAEVIPKGKYKRVYGIPRGGLIVAIYLSHYLKLDWIHTYADLLWVSDLVVDDLVDTGKTLSSSIFKGFDTATIHYKPRSIIKPNYYVEQCANTDWIVYPYEKMEENPNREL